MAHPRRPVLKAAAFILALAQTLILTAANLPATGPPPALSSFLKEKLGLKAADLSRIEGGQPFIRFAGTSDGREVALVGVARLEAPAVFVRDRYRTILTAREKAGRMGVGIFSEPPLPEDVSELSFPESDLQDLRECDVGSCKIKLFTEHIEKVKKEIDWSGSNVQVQVNDVLREDLVELVEGYQRRGDAAIPDYADKEQLMNAAKGFDFLLRESPLLFEYMPDFYSSIRTYPEGQLPEVEDFIYWVVEDPGSKLKRTVFLMHAFMYTSSTRAGRPLVSIAHKKLLASHYYYAALRSATLIDHSEEGKPNAYMIFLDRSLFDGKLGGIQRKMLRSGLKKNLEKEIASIQRSARDLYREHTTP